MTKKVLLTATVQSHIAQFHKPLINMLHEYGYEVHVAARNNLAEKNGLKLEIPDKIFDVPFERSPLNKNNICAYKQLKVILSENKYDVIHCNTPMGGVVTRLAAKESRNKGTKVFYTAHGFHFYKGAPLKNWIFYYPIEKWLAHYTDKLITITNEDYELASKIFKTEVYHVHGAGANSKKYFSYSKDEKEKLRQDLGYSKDDFILICTGELNKNKNQSTVIKAVAEVKTIIPNIKLLVAGNGPMQQELHNLINKLDLSNVVHLLGYRTDLEKYMNICDVAVSASFREGLPINILEAMLCRKPVIASINRGHRELVQEGVTGYLLKPDDAREFARCILKQYQRPNLREELGIAGNKKAQSFKAENVLNELIKVYEIN
jgi:glycosyltransferase EpsD